MHMYGDCSCAGRDNSGTSIFRKKEEETMTQLLDNLDDVMFTLLKQFNMEEKYGEKPKTVKMMVTAARELALKMAKLLCRLKCITFGVLLLRGAGLQ